MTAPRLLRPAGRGLAALAWAGCLGLMPAWASGGSDSGHPSPAAASATSAPAASAAPVTASVAQGTVLPQAPAPTRKALENLLEALPETVDASGTPRMRMVAGRNETVDTAVRRSMGDMPFKDAFLRGVFLEINAAAVQPGTMRLIPGAPLQVPTVADLRGHLQRVLGASAPSSAPANRGAATLANDKRHWVRFP